MLVADKLDRLLQFRPHLGSGGRFRNWLLEPLLRVPFFALCIAPERGRLLLRSDSLLAEHLVGGILPGLCLFYVYFFHAALDAFLGFLVRLREERWLLRCGAGLRPERVLWTVLQPGERPFRGQLRDVQLPVFHGQEVYFLLAELQLFCHLVKRLIVLGQILLQLLILVPQIQHLFRVVWRFILLQLEQLIRQLLAELFRLLRPLLQELNLLVPDTQLVLIVQNFLLLVLVLRYNLVQLVQKLLVHLE